MGIRRELYEWDITGVDVNTVNDLPTAGQEFSIFSTEFGSAIEQTALVAEDSFIVINRVSCKQGVSPNEYELDGTTLTKWNPNMFVQIVVNTTGFYRDPQNLYSAGISGIYFDYWTYGALEWLHVSIMTRQVFIEDGANFYVKIPPTNETWRGAIIPFENIDLPPWDDKDTMSFDPTQIIAIQFSVEGDSGDVGGFAIDNVYLLDTAHVGIKYLTPLTKGTGFSLKQINNRLIYTLPQGTKNAIVNLYNLQGRAIFSQRVKAINNAGAYSLPLRTNMIANGVYIFRVRTLGAHKKVFNKAITLVK